MDIVAFLTARLDEDERLARAATAGPWTVDDEEYAETIYGADHTAVVAGGRWGGEASVFESTEDARHIARHDPPRVLREVAAKRKLVNSLTAITGGDWIDAGEPVVADLALRGLAATYADHPDYNPAWALA